MSADWAKLETHVVDGAFPLQRCVGSTEHSGVFVTQSAQHAPADLALKLVPLDTRSAQAQLARWRVATRLSHPHVLRIFQVGVCQLEGTHYLYVLMEYADQTLAQVLEGRPLTEEEAREMLVPMLGALEYLHRAHVTQGRLQPSNVLVVGDQLKLASDTLRFIGDAEADAHPYDDVHALGATLCEALTRVRPSGGEGAKAVELPAALPASFREIVAQCSSPAPQDRPTIASLLGWLRGEPLAMTPHVEKTIELTSRVEPEVAATTTGARTNRGVLPWVVGAIVLLALCWIAYRSVSTNRPPVGTPSPSPAAPPVAVEPAPVPAPAPPLAPAGVAPNEVLPTVSQSALDTVRGTLRVTVRVSVNKSGTVTAATTDDPGPSRYFERRSLDAAKQWKFPTANSTDPRSMRISFAFTRSGVTASAMPLP